MEKVEQHSDASYAVVLMTLGYFLGRLGHTRVAALVKGDIEKPLECEIPYITIDSEGRTWRALLAKELTSAGLDIGVTDVL